MFVILYQPRTEDEIVVAKFDNEADAQSHMELIKKTKPQAYPFHRIKVIWEWSDSGIEQAF